jgi:hypothetical protein
VYSHKKHLQIEIRFENRFAECMSKKSENAMRLEHRDEGYEIVKKNGLPDWQPEA